MQYSLNNEDFQALLVDSEISRLDKLLLILFSDSESPKSVAKLKEIGTANGLRECVKWNVSDSLSKAKGKTTFIKGNWVLTAAGRKYLITQKYIAEQKARLANDVADLHSHASSIINAQTKGFIEEAISCLEANQKRAAVVYSWIGSVALLYDYVVNHHLAAFNAEALRRDTKWKAAKNVDDLSKLKEFDFLNILEAISVIGKNVKQELQNCLQLRNGCGHPNSLQIGERKVAAHIEILILNVLSRF